MKSVMGLAVTLGIVFFAYNLWLSGEVVKDQGHLLAVAFGVPQDGKMQMHIGVGPRIAIVDPPELNERNAPMWDKWEQDHYQLFDASGQRVPLDRMGTSALMDGQAAAGAPDFVLWAPLEIGARYHLDFVPVVAEGKRYRHEFTVPGEPGKVGRRRFEYVEEEAEE
jgi:hypothetical protein